MLPARYRTLAFFGVIAVVLATAHASAAAARPPNLLFILADDLGWSDTTLYGTTKFYETPNIERLAERGMRFTNAYAPNPLCSPTRASIMTGLYPHRVGVVQPVGHEEQVRLQARVAASALPSSPWLSVVSATRLDTRYGTLAESLHAAGYRTGHFGKWHLGREPYDPLHRGFEVDIPHSYQPHLPADPSGKRSGIFLAPWKWPEGVNYDTGAKGEFIDDRMASEVITFLEANKDRPFFCNWWTYSPHGPPETTPELAGKYRTKAAALGDANHQRNEETGGLMELFDRAVGRVIAAVDRLGLAGNTIIVFTSDNGGWEWLSGPTNPLPMTRNDPLRGGKAQILEGGIRVPLVFVWPGTIQSDSRSEALFSSVDFFPTLLEMVGAPSKAPQKFDGLSQVPALLGRGAPREAVFALWPAGQDGRNPPGASVRQGTWKLIRFWHHNDDQSHRYELYNLAEDIGESNNLAERYPEKVRALDVLITRHLEDTGAVVPQKNPAFDPKQRRR